VELHGCFISGFVFFYIFILSFSFITTIYQSFSFNIKLEALGHSIFLHVTRELKYMYILIHVYFFCCRISLILGGPGWLNELGKIVELHGCFISGFVFFYIFILSFSFIMLTWQAFYKTWLDYFVLYRNFVKYNPYGLISCHLSQVAWLWLTDFK
jgi:hypothetical protein